ncbi:MAG: response regulator [Dehalococcoidales bacterium]|jgi:two-component system alkaline phosphatase synthesis response regulator PhoP
MAQQKKILLVDDDTVFVEAIKTILEKQYQVVTALDGDEGLVKARQEKPDLILLDIIMPTKDGFHVCKQLKADEELASTPVIMLTSFAQHRGETKIPVSAGLELEAEGYIDKPVSPDELLRQVGEMLNK